MRNRNQITFALAMEFLKSMRPLKNPKLNFNNLYDKHLYSGLFEMYIMSQNYGGRINKPINPN